MPEYSQIHTKYFNTLNSNVLVIRQLQDYLHMDKLYNILTLTCNVLLFR